MLRDTPHALMAEIHDAERARERHLRMWQMILERYMGAAAAKDPDGPPTPENYPFGYAAYLLPQLCAQVPAVDIDAVRYLEDEEVARGLKLSMERIMLETNWLPTSRRVTLDAILGWGMTLLVMEPRGAYNAGGLPAVGGNFQQIPHLPARLRISPKHTILDAHAEDGPDTMRLVGHQYMRDLDELRSDDRFDPARVRDLIADVEENEQGRQNEAHRDSIWLYDLYLPEQGRIVTLAKQHEGIILRSEPYWGPDEGPYTLWGTYEVPDQVYPLSPLAACWEQFLELQDHATAGAVEAASHKRLGIYAPGSKAAAERIQRARSGDMVPTEDPNGVRDFEIGGVSPQRLDYVERLRDRLDRNLGYHDAQRGVANDGTATANQIAGAASSLRVDWIARSIEEREATDLRKALWYLVNDTRVKLRFVHHDQETGRRFNAEFRGGPWEGGFINNQWIPPQRPMDVIDFNLAVRPKSMAPEDDAVAQKRVQEEFAIAERLQGMGFPVNWPRLLDRYGAAMGIPNFARLMLMDPQMGPVAPPPAAIGPQGPSLTQTLLQGQGRATMPGQLAAAAMAGGR